MPEADQLPCYTRCEIIQRSRPTSIRGRVRVFRNLSPARSANRAGHFCLAADPRRLISRWAQLPTPPLEGGNGCLAAQLGLSELDT